MIRCYDCNRPLEANLGPTNSHSLRPTDRKGRRPPKYTSETYEPLPKKRGFIRLLNLRASSPDNPFVECELIVTNFNKDDPLERTYEALSWCWGTSKQNAYIHIRKDHKVYAKYVSPELVAALKALRHLKDDRYLWIDAVCIDQDNYHEKNHQVEIMSDIYGRAKRVCIWLGHGDKSSQMALRFIKKEVLQLQNFDELCESEQASQKWGALLDLMQRPWFSRRWVVQEIALARKAVIYCGADKISWKKFAVAVELFVEVETATHRLSEVMKKDPKFYHVPGWFEYVSALGASLLVEATGKLFRDYKPTGTAEPASDCRSESDLDSGSESDSESDSESESVFGSEPDYGSKCNPLQATRGQPLLSLEYLVSSLSIFEASVDHDTIYALLAIAKDTTPSASDEEAQLLPNHTKNVLEVFTQRKRYKVEYEREFVDICKDFVQFCIEHSDPTRALDIICRPWAPEGRKNVARHASPVPKKDRVQGKEDAPKTKLRPQKKPDDTVPLPSWIPQLSGAAYAMYSQAGVHMLKMGRKNADTLVGLPPSNQSLQRHYNAAETKGIDRKALKFRKRPKLGHYSMYVGGFVLDTVVEVQPSSQGGAIPREWVDAAGWHSAPDSDPPDEFWRTLVADRGRDGRNPPVYYSRACKESFFKGGLSSGSVNTTDLINNERCSVVAQFCRRVQAVIWNRSLIKTKTGKLGLASQNVQVGDRVCILYGCSVPVTLRRREKTEEEVGLEVEEDVRHWQTEIATLLARNYKRIKLFRERREEEKLKYAKWEKEMQDEWRKDERWRKRWPEIKKEIEENQMREDERHEKARQENKRLEEERLEKARLEKQRLDKEIQEKGAELTVAYREWRQGTQEKEKEEKLTHLVKLWEKLKKERDSERLEEEREKEERQKQRQQEKLFMMWYKEWKEQAQAEDNEAQRMYMQRSKERQKAKREERIEYGEWLKGKREEARQERERRERARGEEARLEEESDESQTWKEPKINWAEFELFLKYGRRWKERVRSGKGESRYSGEWRWKMMQGKRLQAKPRAGERDKPDRIPSAPDPTTAKEADEADSSSNTLPEESTDWKGNSQGSSKDGQTNSSEEGLPSRASATEPSSIFSAGNMPNRASASEREMDDNYVQRLATKVREKFERKKSDVEKLHHKGVGEDENAEMKKRVDENKACVKENWCYYEFLGECYIHGMMDGEAMKHQNEKGIRARVFELR